MYYCSICVLSSHRSAVHCIRVIYRPVWAKSLHLSSLAHLAWFRSAGSECHEWWMSAASFAAAAADATVTFASEKKYFKNGRTWKSTVSPSYCYYNCLCSPQWDFYLFIVLYESAGHHLPPPKTSTYSSYQFRKRQHPYLLPTILYSQCKSCYINRCLLVASLTGQCCFARWRLSSFVTMGGRCRASRRACGRSGCQHCMAGQYGYIPLGRHLV